MRKRFLAILVLMLAFLGTSQTVPVYASTVSLYTGSSLPLPNPGGVWRNGSGHGMWAVKNWNWCPPQCNEYGGIYDLGAGAQIFWVNPGELTSKYWYDTDGFYTGRGWCTLIQVSQVGYRVGPWRDYLRWKGPATVKLPSYPLHQLQEYAC